MAFQYKAGTGRGCFEDYQKQVTGATPWFAKLTSLNDLPAWWQNVAPELDVILLGADTSIKALVTWHATTAVDGYPLTVSEDLHLRKMFVHHIVNVPELKPAFDELSYLHRPDKTSLSRDGTAAALLTTIIKEVGTSKSLVTARARAAGNYDSFC